MEWSVLTLRENSTTAGTIPPSLSCLFFSVADETRSVPALRRGSCSVRGQGPRSRHSTREARTPRPLFPAPRQQPSADGVFRFASLSARSRRTAHRAAACDRRSQSWVGFPRTTTERRVTDSEATTGSTIRAEAAHAERAGTRSIPAALSANDASPGRDGGVAGVTSRAREKRERMLTLAFALLSSACSNSVAAFC